jgi:preprotein translocase subunit SecF
VHDTIVVFDRIRENRVRHAGEPFGAIVNHSILQTIGRSINTSLTVVVTLTALLLLGPATIRTFALALLLGVVSGTYSSIFNASQLLVLWYEWDAKRRATRSAARTVKAAGR